MLCELNGAGCKKTFNIFGEKKDLVFSVPIHKMNYTTCYINIFACLYMCYIQAHMWEYISIQYIFFYSLLSIMNTKINQNERIYFLLVKMFFCVANFTKKNSNDSSLLVVLFNLMS